VSALKNVGASVHQRLKNAAKESGRSFNDLVQYYALERWLYRLSQSGHDKTFVLKGALMLVAWRAPILRATRDIDLLAKTSNDLDGVQAIIAGICRTEVPNDGVLFDSDTVSTTRIAEDADYEGVRATFAGLLGTTRLSMQIDMGFSDVVTPGPVEISYPTILDFPAPVLRAYNRETAIAEKFEAMISLGRLNSRMKDFFDVWMLANTSGFDGADLSAAILATFRQRGTEFVATPQMFERDFALDPSKQSQWQGFVKRMRPSETPPAFPETVASIRTFLEPIHRALHSAKDFEGMWNPAGPWAPKDKQHTR
jgi:predicted nucleotidyltransferase component of viral defense system